MNLEVAGAARVQEMDDDVPRGRPWTPEAAMEPIPPLAPPPERPGSGKPVPVIPRPPASGGGPRIVVTALAAALIVALLAVLVIVFGH